MAKSIAVWLQWLTVVSLIGFWAAGPLAAQQEKVEAYKSSYQIVDVHAHAALPKQQALQAHLDVMDATGIDTFAILLFDPAGWQYQGGWSDLNLRAWLQLRRQFPSRLIVFGTVDFGRASKEPDFFQQIVLEVETSAERGMQGIKIWKNLGMHHRDMLGQLLKIDDPRLDPLWTRCGELGLSVLIHSADPREYWYPNTFNTFQYKLGDTAKYYRHPFVPTWEELIQQRNNVLQKHPRTTFIGAHFGSLTTDLDQLAELLKKCPNFFVECGARLRFFYRYHPQAVRDFFIQYQDRILFGSDTFLVDDDKTLGDEELLKSWKESRIRAYSHYLEYFETDRFVTVPGGYEDHWLRLKGIALPPEVLEKFYHRNAERLIRGFSFD